MRKRYFAVMVLLLIALYPATSWFMMLVDVANMGSRLIFEPNPVILHLEIGLTVVAACAIFIGIIFFFTKSLDEQTTTQIQVKTTPTKAMLREVWGDIKLYFLILLNPISPVGIFFYFGIGCCFAYTISLEALYGVLSVLLIGGSAFLSGTLVILNMGERRRKP